MEFIQTLKSLVPDYAKDIRLNIDSVLLRSSLAPEDALGCALAASFATGCTALTAVLKENTPEAERNAALTAAAIMGMNNAWYPFVEMAGDEDLKTQRMELRMNAYATHGGVAKLKFESYALAASIVGKCHFCVNSHYKLLKAEGMTVVQLRDVGRIAAVMNSVAQILKAQS